jgi:hypothetical protein
MSKIFVEPFFLLSRGGTSGNTLTFDVSGSKQDTYTVGLRDDGVMGCSCMDSRLNCVKKGCVCKHACFVLVRVLRAYDLVFFEELRMPPAAVQSVLATFRAGELQISEEEMRAPALAVVAHERRQFRECRLRDFSVVAKPPEAGDECPVCYDLLLTPNGPPLLGCPDCGRGLHAVCARRWIAVAPKKTCVYCRSSVWAEFKV